jgi:hypothetical protein
MSDLSATSAPALEIMDEPDDDQEDPIPYEALELLKRACIDVETAIDVVTQARNMPMRFQLMDIRDSIYSALDIEGIC